MEQEQQDLPRPKDNVGIQNTMTNLMEKLSQTFGFGITANKVYSVNWSKFTKEMLVHSQGMLHARVIGEDAADSEKQGHEIIFHDKKGKTAFSLLRTESLEDAISKISHFHEIFPRLVEAEVKDIYTTSMMQKVMDVVSTFPSYKSSHIAVKLGLLETLINEKFVKSSLEQPEEKFGSYPIHIAVEIGNEKVIAALVACDISLEVTDSINNTPMHIAASKSTRVIQALVPLYQRNRNNNFLNGKNSLNETPLSLAAKAEKLNNIKALILLGANINHEEYIHPEFESHEYQDKLQLLEASKDFSSKDMKLGGSLLHWVTTREAVTLAVDLGCKLDLQNSNNETPLHVMVRSDRLQCAVMLMSLQANPNCFDADGNSPLHLAAKTLSAIILRALIAFGADVNVVNEKKETARHLAATATFDSPHTVERERAIFVLRAVGAKSCQKLSSSCNQGCLPEGSSDEIPLMAKTPLQRSRWVLDDQLSRHHVTETIKEQNKNPSGLQGRILCLDGGGIRGLMLCQQLSVIEEFVGRPIHECFDWITGTSTGAFFALNLALQRPISHTQGTYYSLKEQIFVGGRPYDSGPLEAMLKKEFGHYTMMSSIKNVKVNVPTTMADRIPADLHIFRNYEAPIDILGISQNETFVIPPPAEEQLIWQAARASGAAPTFFSLPDKFVDGGLIANNPVLDTLTEIEERNIALKITGREEDTFHPTVVVSIGCGKHPTSHVAQIDLVMPHLLDVGKGMKAASNMILMLVDQACSTEERTVDRARAWCSTKKLPYFRFNPILSQNCELDECNDEKLIEMMWESRSYMLRNSDQIEKLKILLLPPT